MPDKKRKKRGKPYAIKYYWKDTRTGGLLSKKTAARRSKRYLRRVRRYYSRINRVIIAKWRISNSWEVQARKEASKNKLTEEGAKAQISAIHQLTGMSQDELMLLPHTRDSDLDRLIIWYLENDPDMLGKNVLKYTDTRAFKERNYPEGKEEKVGGSGE